MSADILAELARVKALFQLRAICAVIGISPPRLSEVNQQQPRDEDPKLSRTFPRARSVETYHGEPSGSNRERNHG